MPKHKFRAKITERNSIKFSSKAEALYYDKLCLLQRTGEIVGFLRQPMFDIGGGVRHYADFQIFWANENVTFVDIKGYDTPQSKAKRKQTEAAYPWLTIEVVKKT